MKKSVQSPDLIWEANNMKAYAVLSHFKNVAIYA